MFERFTDRARRVVVLAQEEARILKHNYIGTEHVLLGLIHEGDGVAAKSLESLGIDLKAVRTQVEAIIGEGETAPSGHIPFTPRAKGVLELSLREALQLGHNYIGTEHILLGLIREGEGVGCQVLVKMGAELAVVRKAIIQMLSNYQGKGWTKKSSPDAPPPTAKPFYPSHTNKIADEAAEAAEQERIRVRVQVREEEMGERAHQLEREAQRTHDVVSHTYVLSSILNDHGIKPSPELITQLIHWRKAGY